MTAIRAAAQTHTGYVRSNNEDLAVVSSDLAAIADGMGGHLGGEVAARTAIEELVEAFQRDRTASGLVAAVRRANRAIWRRSRVDRKLHGMGTTLTAVALVAGEGDAEGSASHLALVNIGDSRAYRLDYGAEDTPVLTQLTVDHSLVEEMVRQGEAHSRRSRRPSAPARAHEKLSGSIPKSTWTCGTSNRHRARGCCSAVTV